MGKYYHKQRPSKPYKSHILFLHNSRNDQTLYYQPPPSSPSPRNMAPTLHDHALAPLISSMRNAILILRKAEAHAATSSTDPTDYTTARLTPDMNDLCFQVYSFTDSATKIPSSINPSNPSLSLPAEEKTFAELIARIEKALAFLDDIDPSSLAGRDADPVVILHNGIHLRHDTAADYLARFAHPNFWFHVTVMYALLRMKGVPLGKMDFLNGLHTLQFKVPGGEWTTDVSQLKVPRGETEQ